MRKCNIVHVLAQQSWCHVSQPRLAPSLCVKTKLAIVGAAVPFQTICDGWVIARVQSVAIVINHLLWTLTRLTNSFGIWGQLLNMVEVTTLYYTEFNFENGSLARTTKVESDCGVRFTLLFHARVATEVTTRSKSILEIMEGSKRSGRDHIFWPSFWYFVLRIGDARGMWQKESHKCERHLGPTTPSRKWH